MGRMDRVRRNVERAREEGRIPCAFANALLDVVDSFQLDCKRLDDRIAALKEET